MVAVSAIGKEVVTVKMPSLVDCFNGLRIEDEGTAVFFDDEAFTEGADDLPIFVLPALFSDWNTTPSK